MKSASFSAHALYVSGRPGVWRKGRNSVLMINSRGSGTLLAFIVSSMSETTMTPCLPKSNERPSNERLRLWLVAVYDNHGLRFPCVLAFMLGAGTGGHRPQKPKK